MTDAPSLHSNDSTTPERTAFTSMLWQRRTFSCESALGYTFKIYGYNFWVIVKIAAATLLPVPIVAAVLPVAAMAVDFSQEWTVVLRLVSMLCVPLTMIIVVRSLSCGAVIKAVADTYVGRNPNWRESIRHSSRCLCALLISLLLATIGSAAGLIVPLTLGILIKDRAGGLLGIMLNVSGVSLYIFLMTSWSVAEAAIIVEDISGIHGLHRSWSIVSGRRTSVFCTIFMLGLFISLVNGIIYGIFGGARPIVIVISWFLTTPLIFIAKAVIYMNMRVFKEELDIDELADQTGVSLTKEITLPLVGTADAAREKNVTTMPRNTEETEATA